MREKRLSKDRTIFGMEVSRPRDVEQLHRGKGEYFDEPRRIWRKTRGIWHVGQSRRAYLCLVNVVGGNRNDIARHSLTDWLAYLRGA
jgi:hypothetical protein